eukprot:1160745-Pelagomonas_calceolata.AAC.13
MRVCWWHLSLIGGVLGHVAHLLLQMVMRLRKAQCKYSALRATLIRSTSNFTPLIPCERSDIVHHYLRCPASNSRCKFFSSRNGKEKGGLRCSASMPSQFHTNPGLDKFPYTEAHSGKSNNKS